MNETEYSDREKWLFHSLGMTELLRWIPPMPLYKMAVEKAFIEGLSGPNIEALRRASKAILVASQPYRMTEQFEKLLEWDYGTE